LFPVVNFLKCVAPELVGNMHHLLSSIQSDIIYIFMNVVVVITHNRFLRQVNTHTAWTDNGLQHLITLNQTTSGLLQSWSVSYVTMQLLSHRAYTDTHIAYHHQIYHVLKLWDSFF